LFPPTFYGELLRVFNVISLGVVIMLFAMIDVTDPATFFSPSKIVIFTYWLALIVTLSLNRMIYFHFRRRLAGDLPEAAPATAVVQKKLALVAVDLLIIAASYYLSFFIRFEGDIPARYLASFKASMPVVLIIRFSMFLYFKLYSGYYRYASINDLMQILKAVTAGSIIVVVPAFYLGQGMVPRGVFVVDWLLLVVLLGASRFLLRSLRELFPDLWLTGKRTFIIGAGSAAEMLLREIKKSNIGYKPVGLIDDDPNRQGLRLHGVPVLGKTADLVDLALRYKATDAIIAIPSATGSQMRQLVEACRRASLNFKTLPPLREIIDGQVGPQQVRSIRVDDLLGREPVHLNTRQIGDFVNGKHVLVTGGAGSIGSEICRQLLPFGPSRLTIIDRAENRLHEILTEFKASHMADVVRPHVADIYDRQKMRSIFAETPPQVIFHAAAYKQVPLMEDFPDEAVRNNVLGTRTLAQAADDVGVEAFVFISTDKAVRPSSVMGASKRVAELVIQCQARQSRVSFLTVRFGNVLGSDGSVVPLFQRQIEQGGPVTVTHPEVTRYFMTISEASLLVMQAAAIGRSGEIMVLNMGEPVKIVDLAKVMITLSGSIPEEEIPIAFTGLRPGEKLEEELFIEEEGLRSTEHEQILIARSGDHDCRRIEKGIARLEGAARRQDCREVKAILREIVPEYRLDRTKVGS
jgi:FlaA1/EpsC-like NDP-sugar epimerase